MIHIEALSKSYGTKGVLENINLSFDKGQVYGIVGENGAGKTTLFKCIAGMESFAGHIHSAIAPLKNHLGYLATDPYFFQMLTGREYLQLLSHARGTARTDFDEVNIFDLPLDQYATTYSTGMKKKLALTGILLQDNEVYILDEPSNGVDIHSNMIITAIIHRLRELQKTVLVSSHIFSTLKETCDRIHLLENGRITRSVGTGEFDALEKEMKDFTVGDKVDRLKLT